ncbi:ComEA family DNA-binding protein [Trujillonella humicola]|uniref:ComEA family DNA-binding protein n=1 Tax=Trujillonella humicola TaxID=3383699 RepID=UPI00390679F8
MRLSSRRADDADVIRARLRLLLDEGRRGGGWLPDDLPGDEGATRGCPRLPQPEDGGHDDLHPDDPDLDRHDGGPAGTGRHRAPGPAVRVVPARTSVRALVLAAVVGALLLVGWTVLDRPRAEPVDAEPVPVSDPGQAPATPSVGTAADTSSTVTVSVVGQVARPGLVVLPQGARIADAIAAAGGLLPDADPSAVNLAAVVSDGQQIAVAVPGAPAPAGAPPTAPSGRVSLNTAGVAELDALPGIGPVLAQRIVDHRTTNGPFTAIEQLEDVPGIGPVVFDELADLVTV